MPFITESIWREAAPLLGIEAPTIMLQPYPEPDESAADADAEDAVYWLKQVILGIRNIRGEANIKPSQPVNVLFQGGGSRDRALAGVTEDLLKRLGRVETIDWLGADDDVPPNALALVGDLKVMVPLAGLIDMEAEKARLGKEIARREQDLTRLEGKLGNPSFVEKAPEAVVARERQKRDEAAAALATLQDQLLSITG
jgi:valyl-tRNA synthetase